MITKLDSILVSITTSRESSSTPPPITESAFLASFLSFEMSLALTFHPQHTAALEMVLVASEALQEEKLALALLVLSLRKNICLFSVDSFESNSSSYFKLIL